MKLKFDLDPVFRMLLLGTKDDHTEFIDMEGVKRKIDGRVKVHNFARVTVTFRTVENVSRPMRCFKWRIL